MKKLVLFLSMLVACPLASLAQDDDMYFVPTKKNVEKANARYGIPSDTYYSGSNRSVDEYNRRSRAGSSYEVIGNDTSMIDVISFNGEQGVYPDSAGDFSLTKKMSRWEGYTPSEAYWDGYNRGRSDEWYASSWHSPWYYSYYPWYDSWYYDPWYYHHYYGYWGWGGYYSSWYYTPYYYGGWVGTSGRTRTYARTGNAGTLSRYGESHGRFTGARAGTLGSGSARRYGTAASRSSSSSRSYNSGTNRSGNFGGSRSSSSSYNNSVYSSGSSTRSSSGYSGASSSSSSRSGNFGGGGGGSRSGGGIGGGSRGGGRR